MSDDAWTRDELFKGLDPSQDFISELEALALLVVVGQDAQGRSLYARESREALEKVLELVELGYQPVDIAAIATRVGLPVRHRPRFKRAPVHLNNVELAQRAEVTTEQLEVWVEAGLVTPSLRRAGPGGLYVVDVVARVERLRDLSLLGVSPADLQTWTVALDCLDTRRTLRAMSEDEAQAVDDAIVALEARVDALTQTTRRWRRLATTLKRRLSKRRPS
jgi:DNA-binding transcriptional MerR regulator